MLDTNVQTILNAGFETGELSPWRIATGNVKVVSAPVHDGQWSLALGPGPSSAEQAVEVQPNSRYRLSGWVRSGSGSEEIRLGVKQRGRLEKAATSALVSYTEVSVEFVTGVDEREATVFLLHPSGPATAFADGLSMEYLGEAVDEDYSNLADSIVALPPRIQKTAQGIAQQSNDAMRWLIDAKFGMFIHWGLYAGPGRGEWLMHFDKILPDEYRKLAFTESGDEYFSADQYDPRHWAEVAKSAGMKWMCMTARHHDGYCLFDSPHPNAFTTVQTHGRDLVTDYVDACRNAGLKVGLYYSPLSWRYPGYYDVTGTDCKPNVFGYETDRRHKENARLMKEENYVNVRKLMSDYGQIDHIFWDGGWLAEQGSDADAAYFHESGEFLDPNNAWPISPNLIEKDGDGRPLGIMGLVRRYQPHALVNPRYGWIGDYLDQESGPPPTGPIRSSDVVQKCISIHPHWGYHRSGIEEGDVITRDTIIEYLINCVVRDMVFLLNFGPDRHGRMPSIVEERLRAVGQWLDVVGEAVYATRGGPWQPVDGSHGYTCRDNVIYSHLLKDYLGDDLTLPPVGSLRPVRAYDVFTGAPLQFDLLDNRSVAVHGIDRSANPVDTIVAVVFDQEINHP